MANLVFDVLVVEDSPSDALLVRRHLLEGMGVACRIETVETVRQAVERLRTTVYSAILLDLELPDSRNMETLFSIRAAAPTTAIVVLTHEENRELAENTIREGAQDYLYKNSFNAPLLQRSLQFAYERQRMQTELKRRADDLLKAVRGTQQLAECNVDSLVVVDEQGQVLYANPAALALFGKSLAQLKEAPFGFPVVTGETTEVEILQSGTRSIIAEMRVAGIEWEGSIAYLASLRDITARLSLENQLRQAQKIEAIGKLAGGVAHDFNNILCVILGRTQLLLQRTTPDDPIYSELDLLRKFGERAAGLTRQLLAFSRRQLMEPKVIQLNDLVENLEKMLRCMIREDIRFHVKLDPALKRIHVDPGQIEQVIMNLVINARDAIENGGDISIETANVELDEAYARIHTEVTPGMHVLLAVHDTGAGISPETRAHLFEPFFTTKGVGKGTGLGLATVFGIVKQSRGHIQVYSELGAGATFKIFLPAIEASFVNPRAKETLPLSGGHETILIAEDEEEVGSLLKEFLEKGGYTVLMAQNGRHAVTLGWNHQPPIDLLITDVFMPEMNGPEVAERLIQANPGLRVLYTSGYSELPLDQLSCFNGETVAFLQKPFTQKSLLMKVREVLSVPEVKQ